MGVRRTLTEGVVVKRSKHNRENVHVECLLLFTSVSCCLVGFE